MDCITLPVDMKTLIKTGNWNLYNVEVSETFPNRIKGNRKNTEHFPDLVTLITSKDLSNTYKVKPNLYNTVDSSMIKSAFVCKMKLFYVFNYRGMERKKMHVIRNCRAVALTNI